MYDKYDIVDIDAEHLVSFNRGEFADNVFSHANAYPLPLIDVLLTTANNFFKQMELVVQGASTGGAIGCGSGPVYREGWVHALQQFGSSTHAQGAGDVRTSLSNSRCGLPRVYGK
jgi:hypothetical protein